MDSLLPLVASTSQTVPLPVQPLVSKDGKLLTKREIGQVSLILPRDSVNHLDGLYTHSYSSVAKKKDQDTSIYQSPTQQASLKYSENMRPCDSEMHWILNGSIERKLQRRIYQSK